MDDSVDGVQELPAWRPVALDGEGGVEPARVRAPGPAVHTSCLQLDGGLCAAGEAASDDVPSARVHLWSTEDDELEHLVALPGHARGVSTLSFQVGLCRCLMALSWCRLGCTLRPQQPGQRQEKQRCPSPALLPVLLQRETGWLVAGSGSGLVRVWSLERCAAAPSAAAAALAAAALTGSRRLAGSCAGAMEWSAAVG